MFIEVTCDDPDVVGRLVADTLRREKRIRLTAAASEDVFSVTLNTAGDEPDPPASQAATT